ncbi:P450-derived glycosyltransferase activator [Streptomyces sp. NPDC020898]|uniref:P450-derived glycosyltransferase activator n=1 Tax=Streptomyces sp. NPDC020898 TaxID=3365101 RepID=UPI0037927EFF
MTTPGTEPSVLGRRLQLTRAGHWFAGNQDDPYALILRALRDDPTPYEEEIRARGPLFRSELLDTWVTADGALARSVLVDRRFGALTRAGARHRADFLPPAGPELTHEHRRDEAGGAAAAGDRPVSAPREEAVEAVAEKAAWSLLGRLGAEFDLAADYARRLPALVLAELLKLPADVHGRFEDLLTGCGSGLDSRLCPQTLDVTRSGRLAAVELDRLLTRHLGGVAWSAPAALALAVDVAEPSTTLICNAFEALAGVPEQWDALCRDTGLAGAAVEETLWWHPPVRLESRIAQEDVELAGVTVPADGHVVVLVAAAQRDPAIAPAHRGVDLGAGTGRGDVTALPLSLPDAPHAAPAARIVRSVARAALRVLAQDAPGLRPDGEPVRRRRAPVTLTHARYPVARTATGARTGRGTA